MLLYVIITTLSFLLRRFPKMWYPSPGVGIHHLQRFEPSHHCAQQGAVAQATLHLGRRQATSRHFEPCPNGVIFVDVFFGQRNNVMIWK